MRLNIQQLMEDAKCYEVVQELCWLDGVKCPACDSERIYRRNCRCFACWRSVR